MSSLQLTATVSNGTAGPVVLVHGLSQTRHFWGPVIRRLGGVQVYALDARGHGDSGGSLELDFSVNACAQDIVEFCADHDIVRPTLVGHSWGAALVLEAATQMTPHAVVAIDGGFVDMADLGDRAAVRDRLLPPRLGITHAELMTALSHGNLEPYWNDECAEALLPSFTDSADGSMVSVIGYDRHLAVLDGLLDYRPSFEGIHAPAWVVSCEPLHTNATGYGSAEWQQARELGLERAATQLRNPRILRWFGAIHDVPLAWPDLTAGLIRSAMA